MGIVLARHGQVAHRSGQPQARAACDPRRQGQSRGGLDALPPEAGVDLQMQPERASGRLQPLDSAFVVHERFEREFRHGRCLLRPDPPQHEDARVDPGLSQALCLVHGRHGQHADPLGDKGAGHLHIAVTVGVGLDHANDGRTWHEAPDDGEVRPDGAVVDLDPGPMRTAGRDGHARSPRR